MLLVQWHRGRKVLIDAEPDPNAGAIEFPSGWRMVLASMHYFGLSRDNRDAELEVADEIEDDEED